MKTQFGLEVQNGEYCLVLDKDFMHRTANVYPAKNINGKAYTGKKTNQGYGKYIHKLEAICKIDPSILSETQLQQIEEDIKFSIKEK